MHRVTAPQKDKSPLRLFQDAVALLSSRRRRQFGWLCGLMLLGALAESITLGAVVPFVALLIDPDRAFDYPRIQSTFSALGWDDPGQLVLPMTLGFIALVVVATVIRLVQAWFTKRYSFAVGLDLSFGVYKRLLYQPYDFHSRTNSSEVVGAINMAQLVATGIIMSSVRALSAMAIIIGILVTLLWINADIALMAGLIFLAVYLLVTKIVNARLRRNGKVIAAANSSRIRYVQEGMGGIRDVILDGLQPWYLEKYARMERKFRNAQAQNSFIGECPRHIIEGLGIILVVIMGYWLTQTRGGLGESLPILGALVLGAQRLLPQGQAVYAAWTQIAGNHQVLADVRGFLELPLPEKQQARTSSEPMKLNHTIKFENVGFRYAGQQHDVLKSLSYEIKMGERVGISGRTGSGKSTLMDLMMGLLEPTEGRILIDETVITRENSVHWRAQIAHVPQVIYLSDASIEENIAFGLAPENVDHERVRECSEQAQLAEFVESLDHGYSTTVGERGARLSGGQRQRIGIARALYKDAKFLVLDEATSALDLQTEQEIMKTVDEMDRNRIIVIVSHRESTLAICDRRIRLDA